MNDKVKLVTGVSIFVVFIAVASFAYNTLINKVELPDTLSVNDEEVHTAEQAVGNASAEQKSQAPDFTVSDAEDNDVKLSDLFGKPIVLNFWATWCPPCKSEMPEFNKVFEELGDEVTFMMVDLVDGQRETKEKAESYILEQGFTFPVYYDTNSDAAYTYGITSIPTTIFIDSGGYIVTGVKGAIDEETLRKGIELIK